MKKEQKKFLNSIDNSKREFVERLLRTSAFAVPLTLAVSSIKINSAFADESTSCILLGADSSTSGSMSGVPPICISPTSSTMLPDDPILSGSGGATSGSFSSTESTSMGSSVSVIPEPSTIALIGLGIAGVALAKLNKDSKQTDIETSEK